MINYPSRMRAYLQPRRHALVLALLILLADDLSKAGALAAWTHGQLPLWLVPGQVGLALSWNRGMSFSLLNNSAYAPYLLATVAILAVGYFTHWLAADHNPKPWPSLHQAGLAVIIGGALGNLLDRLQHGAVIDFLILNPAGLFPYAFNLADAAISLGVALLLLDLQRKPR